MTDKLAEEIKNQVLLDNKLDAIIKRRIIIDTSNFEYCAKNNVINGFLLAGIRSAMREYAKAYHESKLKEALERENQYVTDEDIKDYALRIKRRESLCTVNYYATGFIEGAIAMRDGKIKHVSRDNE